MLANVFENFKNMRDPEKFLSAPGLAWQTASKKAKVKFDLLTDIDIPVI